jgi:hypothetical protein
MRLGGLVYIVACCGRGIYVSVAAKTVVQKEKGCCSANGQGRAVGDPRPRTDQLCV